MKKKWYHLISAYVLGVVLLLSGCGTNPTSGSDKEVDSDAASEDVWVESEYDDIIFDRTLTEGKMAAYYFHASDAWKYEGGTLKAGDSVLYIAPDGTTMLIDCGTPNFGAYIVHALQQLGIEKLDYFVNSHPHNDHIGGFSILSRHIEIGQVYMVPAEFEFQGGGTDRPLNTVLVRKLEEYGIPYDYLIEGDSFKLGNEVNVQIYNPPVDFDYANVDYNECSMLMKITYGDSSFLTGGDLGNDLVKMGRASTTELISKYGTELQADVAKMNHHGNFIGTTGLDEWIETIGAKVHVGVDSAIDDEEDFLMYGLDALALHTSLDGNICISTTGDGTYDVQVGQERYSSYYGKVDTENGLIHVE